MRANAQFEVSEASSTFVGPNAAGIIDFSSFSAASTDDSRTDVSCAKPGKDKRFGLTTTKVAPDEKDKISIRAVTTANVHRTGLSDTIEMSPFARGVVVGTDGAVARAVATGPALSCPAGKEEPGVVVVSPM